MWMASEHEPAKDPVDAAYEVYPYSSATSENTVIYLHRALAGADIYRPTRNLVRCRDLPAFNGGLTLAH